MAFSANRPKVISSRSMAAQTTSLANPPPRGERARKAPAPALASCSETLVLQCGTDLLENQRIIDRGRHGPGLAVGDLLHGAAQDFPRPRLRQPPNCDRELEGRDRPAFFAHQGDTLLAV